MRRLCASVALVVGLMFMTASVKADVVIELRPSGLAESENILFNLDGGPAATIQGSTQQTGLVVDFIGDELLVAPSGGQARVEGADGGFTDLMIQLAHPLGVFTGFEFNVIVGNVSGEVTITADLLGGGSVSETLPVGAGENRTVVIATEGDLLTKITIASNVEIQDLRQPRIDGAQIIPLPASVWAGAGLFGLLAAARIRRMMKA